MLSKLKQIWEGGKDLKGIKLLQILWKLTAVQSREKLLTILSPTEGASTAWINTWLTSESPQWISRSSYRILDVCSVAHKRKSLNLSWLTPVRILVQLKKFWPKKTALWCIKYLSQVFESKYCLFLQKLISSLTKLAFNPLCGSLWNHP